jgi:predicted regulator of Ras-like GTPase activity (Roadblock/LC7/MglB family)
VNSDPLDATDPVLDIRNPDIADAPAANDQGLGWLVSNFVDRIPGATSAVVVSSDGLVLTLSQRVDRDAADQMAAITSGIAGLTAGAARCFAAGKVIQVIVEMEGGYLFVTGVSDGSSLAVLCEATCDIGLIGYEMSLLVARLGQLLTPELIAALQSHSLASLESLES